MARQADKHLDVRFEQTRHQQVASKSNELVECNLREIQHVDV